MTEIKDPPRPQTRPPSRQQIKEPRRRAAERLLVDAHVHCHECFDRATFLDHAAKNFDAARRGLNQCAGIVRGCLLLAENPWDEFFDDLKASGELWPAGAHRSEPSWRIEPTDEECSLNCVSGDGTSIIVIAGRQIVVREGLEVLALCTEKRFPVGRSLKWTLEDVIRAGAIPVIPWGFGKWWGERGTLVRKVLESGFSACVFIGDNGNRPRCFGDPRLFELAAERNVRILPGSDPLPMPWHTSEPGRCGFVLKGKVEGRRPAQWIKRALKEAVFEPRSILRYGRGERLTRFCTSQIAMQIRNRMNRWM